MSLAVVVAAALVASAAQAPNTASQQTALQKGRPPIVVDVVSVDQRAGTLTVRELDTVPARKEKPVEVTLPVGGRAGGERLSRIKAGQRVAITCDGEAGTAAAAPTSAPVALADCVRVIEIDARPIRR